MHAPIVTLSTKDIINFTKQLNEGFKRSVYWNEYKSKIETKEADANNLKRFSLDFFFQGVNRLFVLALTIRDQLINQLMVKSKSMMKLERLQQKKEMITQLVAC